MTTTLVGAHKYPGQGGSMQHVVHSLAGLVTVLQAPNIALDERKAVLAFGGDAFPHLIQVAPVARGEVCG